MGIEAVTDQVHVACNHTRIEFVCRPASSRHHRWYGCLGCGLVFEVAEQGMMSPDDAAKMIPAKIDYRAQHEIVRFRAEGHDRPPALPFCAGCDAPHAGLGGHTCARFKVTVSEQTAQMLSACELGRAAELPLGEAVCLREAGFVDADMGLTMHGTFVLAQHRKARDQS